MSDCVVKYCKEPLYIDSWRCSEGTTSTTTSSSTTTTTSSTTTTTTTTVAPEHFVITNNSEYNDLEYFVFAIVGGTTLLFTGFVQSGQTKNHYVNIPTGATSLTFWVKQYSGNIIYINTSLQVDSDTPIDFSYGNGISEFQYNDVDATGDLYTLIIDDETPITTTTTTSTSTTSTTSTSTTSTTSSTTSTTTTTEARENLIIRILNNGPAAIGFNTQSWNISGSVQTSYYALTGGALVASGTQTPYNSMVGVGNQTRFRYENTAEREIILSLYWSNDNGATYSLVGSVFIPPYSGSGSYPFDDSIYTTIQSSTTGNILEARVTPF